MLHGVADASAAMLRTAAGMRESRFVRARFGGSGMRSPESYFAASTRVLSAEYCGGFRTAPPSIGQAPAASASLPAGGGGVLPWSYSNQVCMRFLMAFDSLSRWMNFSAECFL